MDEHLKSLLKSAYGEQERQSTTTKATWPTAPPKPLTSSADDFFDKVSDWLALSLSFFSFIICLALWFLRACHFVNCVRVAWPLTQLSSWRSVG